EALQGGVAVAAGPRLEADGAVIAGVDQGRGDGRVVDLTCAGFVTPGHIGDLDLADERPGSAHEIDQVSLADLRVVQVKHHPQVYVVDGSDQGHHVLGPREGGAGVVHGGVEVLEGEDDAFAAAEGGETGEGLLR